MRDSKIQDIEIELLVRALQLRYDHDFSGYAPASFKRRVQALLMHSGLSSVSALTEKLLHDESFLPEVVGRLSVPVSEMFRDPEVFKALVTEVFPVLASYPHFNIWQAGCAHGEEVYSLAILLVEAGLYGRARIYATDISAKALDIAREGILPAREARQYSENYRRAGGRHTLSDYFHARYGHIKLDDALKRNIVFDTHNLATDGVFCEAHLILCRNVLIYFRPGLQQRVVRLFRDSLVRGGFLGLGTKETLAFSEDSQSFEPVAGVTSLYRLGSGHAGT
ncbi:MAG TPA: protein-glutamate O-methyltransferase CheR [Solimonas sp.]|nr:protein-glutamate O-methyltransferase CheR [Solimonas sp.]